MGRLFISIAHFFIMLAAAQGFTVGDPPESRMICLNSGWEKADQSNVPYVDSATCWSPAGTEFRVEQWLCEPAVRYTSSVSDSAELVLDDLKVNCEVDQITVMFGRDLLIGCRYHPVNESKAIAFYWMKVETMVIIYNYSSSSLGRLDPSYQRRAKVDISEIRNGNVSLKLKNVTVSDSGLYRLSVTSQSQSNEITVAVDIRAIGEPPIIYSYVTEEGIPMLVCESSGWFPEPTVTWENGLGKKMVKHVQTETINYSNGTFHTKSTIRIDNGIFGNYTCTITDRQLNKSLSFEYVVLIAGSHWNIIIGTAGTIILIVFLIVSVYWSC